MDIIGVTQRFRNDGNNHLKAQLPPLIAPIAVTHLFHPPPTRRCAFDWRGRGDNLSMRRQARGAIGGMARNLREGGGKLEFTIKDYKITGEDTLKNGQKIKPILMHFS